MKSIETFVTEILDKHFTVIRRSQSNLLKPHNIYFLIVKTGKLFGVGIIVMLKLNTQKSEMK